MTFIVHHYEGSKTTHEDKASAIKEAKSRLQGFTQEGDYVESYDDQAVVITANHEYTDCASFIVKQQ